MKRFEVRATDDLGDVHIFWSDDRDRAEGVAEAMREDIEDVVFNDHEAIAG